jgi:hypothetical protein
MPTVVPLALRGDDVRALSQMCRERARVTALPEVHRRYTRIADRLDEASRQAHEVEREGSVVS